METDRQTDPGYTKPTFEDILAAAQRIEGIVHRTPVLTSRTLNDLLGAELFFKAENLQRGGAFKARGATHAVQRLGDEAARGVATHSSGNHGGALALAARERGIPCWVVMPEGAVQSKVDAVQACGATVVWSPPNQAGREATADRVVAETGATMIHPFEHSDVIAGQGTATLELLDEVPDLDAVVVPLGGGGLLAGAVIATEARSPTTEVIGAEPSGADDGQRSLAAGRIVAIDTIDTIADGLRATLGRLAFSILSERSVRIETATDDEIRSAMRLVWSRLKTVVEPSGVVPLAVLLNGSVESKGRRIGLILSGGNVDFPL